MFETLLCSFVGGNHFFIVVIGVCLSLSAKAINKSRLGNVRNVNKLAGVSYDVTGIPTFFFIEAY